MIKSPRANRPRSPRPRRSADARKRNTNARIARSCSIDLSALESTSTRTRAINVRPTDRRDFPSGLSCPLYSSLHLSVPQLLAAIQREFKYAAPLPNSFHPWRVRPDRIVVFYGGRAVLSNGCQQHVPSQFDQHGRSPYTGPVQHWALHTTHAVSILRIFFLPIPHLAVLPTVTYPT